MIRRYSIEGIEATISPSIEKGSARERLYLLARIEELMQAIGGQSEMIAQLRRDVAFEKAVNERVGQVVVEMFKKLQS